MPSRTAKSGKGSMPYKSDKIIIAGSDKDRRIKLSEEDKQEIRTLASSLSQREIARKFKISRRLVSFVLNPSALEENKKRRAERGGWKQYYNKDAHAKSMRETGRYKHRLFVNGIIKE